MPLAARRHKHDGIEQWLWGLLPDNENVLARWARRFQVSARSAFSLLTATGEDCPGAVQFVRPERVGQGQGDRAELGDRRHGRARPELLPADRRGGDRQACCALRPGQPLPYPGRYAPRLKLAMKIGGKSRIGYVRVRHWERFAAEESVAAETPDRLSRIVADSRAEGMDHPIVARLEEAVTEQAKACLDCLRR